MPIRRSRFRPRKRGRCSSNEQAIEGSAPWVVPEDLQAIYDYHRQLSLGKAERIVAEYDRVVSLLEVNPLLFHEREGGWRMYPFDTGTYLLYYKELESLWPWLEFSTRGEIPHGLGNSWQRDCAVQAPGRDVTR